MSKNGSFDFRELKEFQKNFKNMTDKYNKFLKKIAQKLAQIWLNKVKKRTPVITGTLRDRWRIAVQEKGNEYLIILSNPLEYAPYVENGHRTRNHKGWVNGQFMMTISKQEVEDLTPKLIEKELQKLFEEAINDK